MAKARYGHCFYGVDYSVPPHELTDTALGDAQNVVPNSSGLPSPRGGSVSLNNVTLGSRITSFFEYRSGTTRSHLCSYSTKIGLYSSTTRTFSDLITGLTSDKMVQWVNFDGYSIGVNEGSDAPQYYNGTVGGAVSALGDAPPLGNAITTWANRVYLLGDSTNVALLTGCALNDITDWTTTGTASSRVSQTIGDSKDPITGGIPYFDMLLVGKRNTIYKVFSTTEIPTDASSLVIKPLYSKESDSVGFTSPWAITQVGNDIIFLDGYDIKRLSGIQEYGDVEHASIIPHFRDFLKGKVDKNYLKYTQFFHYKKEQQIWVTIPTAADTHFVFVLDYKFKRESERFALYPMADLPATCFGGVEDGELTDIYYGDESGRVHKLDTGYNDNGVAIESYFVTVVSGNNASEKIYDKHEIRKQFNYTEADIKVNTTNLTMVPYYAKDLMDAESIRTSGNYTALDSETITDWAGTGVKSKRLRFFGISAKVLALKWYCNSVSQSFTFYPSMVNYTWKTMTDIV